MSSGTSTPSSAPKSMSSRLLTMKFMQRAAASSPTTPTPSMPDEPSAKRRKKDSGTQSPSTSSFDVNVLADQRAIQAAIASEEAKKEAALERAAYESGDTRWVLSFEDQRASSSSSSLALRVVQTGYANLDAPSSSRGMEEDMEEEKPVMVGRRSFGKFNKVLEKKEDGEDESESSSEEDEDEESEEESDDDDPASEMIRASRQEAVARAKEERKKQKRAEKAESEKLAKKRKKNGVNLNGLTSLSGRAPSIACHSCGGPHHKKDCPQPKAFSGACYNCGGPHLKKDCPQTGKRGYQGRDDGPPRKTIKSR